MGEFIEDFDVEIEQNYKKLEILENKKGLPDSKVLKRRRNWD